MVVGYRFHPTDEELINHYLTNQILGKTWLVNEAITELNIYNHDPESLPLFSRIKSDDLVWYFFAPVLYTSDRKNLRKRSTASGYWKPTGKDRKITDKSGKREIGDKKSLVYHSGKSRNGVRTPWIMHEYHIKCSPHHPSESWVICKIKYKGEKAELSYGNRSGEPSCSLVSDLNTVRTTSRLPEVEQPGGENDGMSVNDLLIPVSQQEDLSLWDLWDPNNDNHNVQLQAPYLDQDNDEFWDGFDPTTWLNNNNNLNVQPQIQNNQENTSISQPIHGGQAQELFSIGEFIMQHDYNHYRPKKSLSGIIVDYSTDSDRDAESISATLYTVIWRSYHGTSSPCDSIGSSNRHFPSCRDETLSSSTDSSKYLQTSEDPSINRKTRESQLARCNMPSKQEVKEAKSKAVDAYMAKESSMEKTEKGWFVIEEAVEKRGKPQYIYLVNMIIGLILLWLSLATSYRFY